MSSVAPILNPHYLVVYRSEETTQPADKLAKLVKSWRAGILSTYQAGRTNYPMIPKGSIEVIAVDAVDEKMREKALLIIDLPRAQTKRAIEKRKRRDDDSAESSATQSIDDEQIAKRAKVPTHLLIQRAKNCDKLSSELTANAAFWKGSILRAHQKSQALPPRFPTDRLSIVPVTYPTEGQIKDSLGVIALSKTS